MMKLSRILVFFFAAAVAVCSCKKEEEETTYKYVGGRLSISMPAYVKYGDVYTLRPKGAYLDIARKLSDGSYVDTLGYSFANPFTGHTDTTKLFGWPARYKDGRTSKDYEFKIDKDTLATLSVTAYAFAPDYYSNSSTVYFSIVSDSKSLVDFPVYSTDGSMDVDGWSFPTTDVAGKTWMRRNLARKDSGEPFHSCVAMNYIYGGYFTWTEAQTACPSGWHVASKAEWAAAAAAYPGTASLMADVYFNQKNSSNRLWLYSYKVGTITDKSHLSVLPLGFATISSGAYTFSGYTKRAVFWTSDSDGADGVYAEVYEDQPELRFGALSKSDVAASVRCVKD